MSNGVELLGFASYNEHPVAIIFDHADGSTRTSNLDTLSRNIEDLEDSLLDPAYELSKDEIAAIDADRAQYSQALQGVQELSGGRNFTFKGHEFKPDELKPAAADNNFGLPNVEKDYEALKDKINQDRSLNQVDPKFEREAPAPSTPWPGANL